MGDGQVFSVFHKDDHNFVSEPSSTHYSSCFTFLSGLPFWSPEEARSSGLTWSCVPLPPGLLTFENLVIWFLCSMVPLCQPSLEAFVAQSLNDESFGKIHTCQSIKISPTEVLSEGQWLEWKECVWWFLSSHSHFPVPKWLWNLPQQPRFARVLRHSNLAQLS